jgi:hypothetical protein
VVDDRAALNTLANTTLQPNGGIIYFASPFTYRISSAITFPANVLLIFPPGASLSIDTGITVTMLGTIMAALSQIFGGLGVVVFLTGATREPKTVVLASPTISGSDSLLPRPGDADESIIVPSFSTIKSLRLVIAEAHPTNGLTTTYALRNSDGSVTYLTQAITDANPAMTNEVDTELTLPHVTGLAKTVKLVVTGTDTLRFKGWVEVTFY